MLSSLEGFMYCQVCGARNREEQEYCRSCHQKLMVVSGPFALEEQEVYDSNPEEQFSFDEHLLERISILEEVVKRSTESLRHALGTLYKLEQQILVNQTGVTTLRDLLESKRVIAREEWSELWESRMDYQLLALEKRERFTFAKERMAGLYNGEDPEEFHRLLDEAEFALLSLDIETAVQALDRAYKRDPTNYELAFFLGETFLNDGDGETALLYFTRVLTAKPKHFESLVYSAILCHEHRDSARAEKLLKMALARYPDTFMPAFSLGAIHAASGRLNEAMVLLTRAVAIDPVPQAFYLLGHCCYEMGRVSEAIRHLREVVRMDPSFEEAYQLLGLAYLDRRWYRKSLEALGEAQRLHPKKLQYHELRRLIPADIRSKIIATEVSKAEASLDRGEIRSALTAFRHALSEDPDNPSLLVAYAMACLELGRTQEVESVIGKALELEPDERLKATANATLMEALRFQGHYREGNRVGHKLLDEAESDFTRAVACFEIAFNLAEIEEDLDEALDYARRSVKLACDEVESFSLAALGWVYFKRRNFSKAVDCLEKSAEIGPSSRTLTHFGMALLAAGKRDQARTVLHRARQMGHGALGEKVLEILKDGTRRLQNSPP